MLLSVACQHELIRQALLEMLNHSRAACYLGNKPCTAEERCCERKKMRSPSRGSDTLKVIGRPQKPLCQIAAALCAAHSHSHMVILNQLTPSGSHYRTNINHQNPLILSFVKLKTYRPVPPRRRYTPSKVTSIQQVILNIHVVRVM